MSKELAHIELRMTDAGGAKRVEQEIEGNGVFIMTMLALLIENVAEVSDTSVDDVIQTVEKIHQELQNPIQKPLHIEMGEIERAWEKIKDERREGEA